MRATKRVISLDVVKDGVVAWHGSILVIFSFDNLGVCILNVMNSY